MSATKKPPKMQLAANSVTSTKEHGAISIRGPCSICLEPMHSKHMEDNDVVETECRHFFHDGCLMQWLEKHNLCPFCRYQIFEDAPLPEPQNQNHLYTGTNAAEFTQAPHYSWVTSYSKNVEVEIEQDLLKASISDSDLIKSHQSFFVDGLDEYCEDEDYSFWVY